MSDSEKLAACPSGEMVKLADVERVIEGRLALFEGALKGARLSSTIGTLNYAKSQFLTAQEDIRSLPRHTAGSRCAEMEKALGECQRVLAELTRPSIEVSGLAIANMWAQCVAAETRARALLKEAEGVGQHNDGER